MARKSNPNKPLRLRRSALFLALIIPFAASAQTEQAKRLDDVVVSASGFEQEIKDAPASITVIPRKELETKQFRDLAEALQDVEGIDVRGGTGKTGGLDISIRGMPSEYTLILIDGRRQNTAGDVTPNGFGAAMTSFMPPIAAIERIEVIRGPMSTLYGSDAMGGVVNIITRKVAKEWNANVSMSMGVPQDSEWGTQTRTDFYANGPLKEGVLGLAVRGGMYRREASDRVTAPGALPTGRNPAPAESRQHNLGARLTLTPNQYHDLWLDVEQNNTWYNNEDCRLGNVDSKVNNSGGGAHCLSPNPLSIAPGYKDALRFNRNQIAIGHNAKLDFGRIETSLMRSVTETMGRTIPGGNNAQTIVIGDTYVTDGKTFTIGGDRELKTTNTVFDTKLITPLGNAHVATVGAQYWDAKLVDGLLPSDHKQTMYSLFGEDEWSFTKNVKATFGARYDHHDVFGSNVSPRAYLVWNTTPSWTLKGGVSQGFKAPSINRLIDGISGVGGQGTNISIGNPNLKPEKSTSTELSALYDGGKGLSGGLTLFHNKVKDKIGSGGDCSINWISSCASNTGATYSINVDEATTWGMELSSRVQLAKAWAFKVGYTWTDSEVIENGAANGKLANTAKHIANAQLDWKTTEKLRMWLRGEYRGESQRFSGDPSQLTGNNRSIYDAVGNIKAYSLFHLGGAYVVSKNVTINANIFNLLNKDFRKYQLVDVGGTPTWVNKYVQGGPSTTGTTPAGRTFWLSANISF